MIKLVWSSKFTKAASKLIKKNPEITELFKSKIRMLEKAPFDNSLKTHKLKGNLSSYFACSLDYQYRIVFQLCEQEPDCLKLINIGTHDEVY